MNKNKGGFHNHEKKGTVYFVLLSIYATFVPQKYTIMKRIIYTILLIALTGCQGKTTNRSSTKKIETATIQTDKFQTTIQEEQFPFPEIPTTLSTPNARKDYLLRNYWSRFDFKDTLLLKNRNVTEQGFVNFIALLGDGQTEHTLIDASMKTFCEGMMPHIQARDVFGRMSKDYLFNPNSPMYSEALYVHYLQAVCDCTSSPTGERQRAHYLLRLIQRNRPGETSTDFTYYNKEGKRMTLAQTPVEGNRLLLLFFDPECDECHETLSFMQNDIRLAEAIRTKKLTVLAIYTEGNEEVWKTTQNTLPTEWIMGTDHYMIKRKSLYDLKAMPCLYLLDGEKRVIVKDGKYEQIRAMF